MPRNLPWSKEEIILALALYFDPHRGGISTSNPNVINLSTQLNKLRATDYVNDEEKFRNPNGVCLKLSNFLAIDPRHDGKGMTSFSKLDEELFKKYSGNLDLLKSDAARIRERLK